MTRVLLTSVWRRTISRNRYNVASVSETASNSFVASRSWGGVSLDHTPLSYSGGRHTLIRCSTSTGDYVRVATASRGR